MRNHPIPRGRGKRGGDVKSKTDRYIGQNIAIARHVLSNPDIHPVITVEWARLVMARQFDKPASALYLENRQDAAQNDDATDTPTQLLLGDPHDRTRP